MLGLSKLRVQEPLPEGLPVPECTLFLVLFDFQFYFSILMCIICLGFHSSVVLKAGYGLGLTCGKRMFDSILNMTHDFYYNKSQDIQDSICMLILTWHEKYVSAKLIFNEC